MPPQGAPPQPGQAPGNINWPAVHAAFNQHVQQMGNQPQQVQQGQPMQPGQQPQPQVGGNPAPGGGAPFVPQPQQNGPGYAMLIHAMSKTGKEPGEDPESMILRALEGHLKRITPDVSSIHKDQQKPNTGGGAY